MLNNLIFNKKKYLAWKIASFRTLSNNFISWNFMEYKNVSVII